MLTMQEVFDRSATHLLKQGYRSENARGSCMYRGPRGGMCAVGALISDKHYSPFIEGRGVTAEDVRKALRQSGVPIDDRDVSDLLEELQEIHDRRTPSDWKHRLLDLADGWLLSTKAINAL